MDKVLKVILIGAGNRGETYTDIMAQMSDKFKVIAVAEPIESRRNNIQKKHQIADNLCFEDWKPLLDLGKIADVAVISTMDKQHLEPTLKAISLQYDILLEKPVSPDPEECNKIADYAEQMGSKVIVCHVLRYTPFFITIKELINDGRLGDIISVNHEECVGNVHQSHSFVRGNWGNSKRSSCMLLQKSCHDMDILQWLIGKKCKKVQSLAPYPILKRKMLQKMHRTIVFRDVRKQTPAHIMLSDFIWTIRKMTGFEQPQPEKQIPLMKWWKQHFVQHNMESVYSNVITML